MFWGMGRTSPDSKLVQRTQCGEFALGLRGSFLRITRVERPHEVLTDRKSRRWPQKSEGNKEMGKTEECISEHLKEPSADAVAESRIAEWRRAYASGTLPKWQIDRIEKIPGWSWTGGAA